MGKLDLVKGLGDALSKGLKNIGSKSKSDAAKPATPKRGGVGVAQRKKSSAEIGKCGEQLAKQDMEADGFEVVEVQNKSGHGIDLIGRNKDGNVKVWEVKTTEGTKAPSLSKDQSRLGGEDFTNDRLKRATEGQGNYGKVPEAKKNAKKVKNWIKKSNGKVSYEKYEVFIDDSIDGCAKHPSRAAKPKPWPGKK